MRKVNRLCQNRNFPHKKQRFLRKNRRFVRKNFFIKDTKSTEKSVFFHCSVYFVYSVYFARISSTSSCVKPYSFKR